MPCFLDTFGPDGMDNLDHFLELKPRALLCQTCNALRRTAAKPVGDAKALYKRAEELRPYSGLHLETGSPAKRNHDLLHHLLANLRGDEPDKALRLLTDHLMTHTDQLAEAEGSFLAGQAAKHKKVETLRRLLERGVDPNAGDRAPLFWAVKEYRNGASGMNLRATLDCVETLISFGADVNATDATTCGMTPLMYALEYNASAANQGVVTALIEHRANVNAYMVEMDIMTPLKIAVGNNQSSKTIRFLVENGATLNGDASGRERELICSEVLDYYVEPRRRQTEIALQQMLLDGAKD